MTKFNHTEAEFRQQMRDIASLIKKGCKIAPRKAEGVYVLTDIVTGKPVEACALGALQLGSGKEIDFAGRNSFHELFDLVTFRKPIHRKLLKFELIGSERYPESLFWQIATLNDYTELSREKIAEIIRRASYYPDLFSNV